MACLVSNEQEGHMGRVMNYDELRTWLLVLAVAALATGCGGSGGRNVRASAGGGNFGTAGTAQSLGTDSEFGAFGSSGVVTSCDVTTITGDVGTTAVSTSVTGLTDENGVDEAYSPLGCPGIGTRTIITDVLPSSTAEKK